MKQKTSFSGHIKHRYPGRPENLIPKGIDMHGHSFDKSSSLLSSRKPSSLIPLRAFRGIRQLFSRKVATLKVAGVVVLLARFFGLKVAQRFGRFGKLWTPKERRHPDLSLFPFIPFIPSNHRSRSDGEASSKRPSQKPLQRYCLTDPVGRIPWQNWSFVAVAKCRIYPWMSQKLLVETN